MILEQDQPAPPRFWWLKRLTIIYAIVIAAIVGLRIWWQHAATKRLNAEINAIRASGQPFYAEDFAGSALADELNAADYYLQANRAFTYAGNQRFLIDNLDISLPTRPQQLAALSAFVDANTTPFALIRHARDIDRADWKTPAPQSLRTFVAPRLNDARTLAITLKAASYVEHHRGHHVSSVEYLRDILRVGRMLYQHPPMLISHLTTIGILSIPSLAAQEFAHRIVVDGNSRGPMKAMIDELLDESADRNSGITAWYGERAMTFYMRSDVTMAFSPFPKLANILFQPMFDLDARRMIHRTSVIAIAANEMSFPAVKKKLPVVGMDFYGAAFVQYTRIGSMIFSVPGERAISNQFRMLMEKRAAAIMLAIRLYQADHENEYPPALEALVPNYLPAVPTDLFDPAGGAIRYLREPSPRLYSVGDDGKDDGGSEIHPRGRISRQRWELQDAVFHYIPPLPPPSLETQDDQAEVDISEGNQSYGEDGQ